MNPTTPPAPAPAQTAEPARDASDPGTGTSHGAATDPAASEDAQQPLTRLLERLAMVCTHPWRVMATELAVYAGVALVGVALRLLAGPPWWAAAGIGAAAVVAAELLPAPRRRSRPRPAPAWAAAAQAADAGLPAGLLDRERASLAGFAACTGRRGAFMHLAACQPKARYPGLCQSALIHEQHGYLLAVLGEHLQPVATATLSHELAHLSGWPHKLANAAVQARLAGWLLAGWVAGWPWLLAAGATVQAVTMLTLWAVEAGCDRHAAREYGAAAVITAVTSSRGTHPRQRRWEPHVISGLQHLTGLTRHPPAPLRCWILYVLAPPSTSNPPGG